MPKQLTHEAQAPGIPTRQGLAGKGLSWTRRWLLPPGPDSIPRFAPIYLLAIVCLYPAYQVSQHATVIAPFHLPADNHLPFNEQTVANALHDVFRIVREDTEFWLRENNWTLVGFNENQDSLIRLPEITRTQVPSRVVFEVKGLSHDGLVAMARKVLRRERTISGDVMITGPEQFELVARSDREGPWHAGPAPSSPSGLHQASEELAFRMMADLDPVLLALYELRHGYAETAYTRLEASMGSETTENAKRAFELIAILSSMNLKLQPGSEADAAIRRLEKARELLPESWVLAFALGVTLYEQTQTAAAIDAYRTAIELKPDFAEAHYNLGVTLEQEGRRADAHDAFKRAVGLLPAIGEAPDDLAIAVLQVVPNEGTIETLRKIEPNFADVYNNLGHGLAENGRAEEAIDWFRKAIEEDPEYAEAHQNLGIDLLEVDQVDGAIESLGQAVTLEPMLDSGYYNLGWALFQGGRFAAAAESFRVATEREPDFADAHYYRGLALVEEGRYAEAVQSFRVVVWLRPDFAEAHLNLGEALWQQGQFFEALEPFRTAAELKPELEELAGLRWALFEG